MKRLDNDYKGIHTRMFSATYLSTGALLILGFSLRSLRSVTSNFGYKQMPQVIASAHVLRSSPTFALFPLEPWTLLFISVLAINAVILRAVLFRQDPVPVALFLKGAVPILAPWIQRSMSISERTLNINSELQRQAVVSSGSVVDIR